MKKYFGIILLILFYSSETFAVENKSWKFLDNYLTPKCFVYEWMSSDNFEDYYLKYGPNVIEAYSNHTQHMSSQQKSDFFFKRIGHYFFGSKSIPAAFTAFGNLAGCAVDKVIIGPDSGRAHIRAARAPIAV